MKTTAAFAAPQYAPDVSDTSALSFKEENQTISRRVENVVPMINGYAPLPAAVQFARAPNGERLHSLYCHYYTNEDYDIFAGSERALYIWNKERLQWIFAGAYNAPWRWSFCSYRNVCLCCNPASPVVYFDRKQGGFVPLKNSDETVYKNSDNVEIAPDGVPYADYCFIADSFLILVKGNRLMWSAPDQIDFWTLGQNSCGDVFVPQGGSIRYVSPEYSPIVLCDKAIYRLSRVNGDNKPFSLVKINTDRGCAKPFAAATVDSTTYFIDREGFFSISGGGLQRIGYQMVDRTYRHYISDKVRPVSVAADAYNNRVIFLFHDRGLYYDYALQKWTAYTHGGESAALMPFPNTVLEQADPEQKPLSGERPRSFDNLSYLHGAYRIAWVNARGGVDWQGSPDYDAAVIETGIFGFQDGAVFLLDDIYAISDYDKQVLRLEIDYTNTREPNEEVFLNAEFKPNSYDGKFIANKRCRFARLRFYLDTGRLWRKFQGARIAARPSGII